jgi:hypothetical protein
MTVVQVTRVRCGNPNCGRVFDQSPDIAPSDRPPCPDCGSRTRNFDVLLSDTVHVSASLSWIRIHGEVERSWPWLLGSLTLTIAGSLVGVFLAGLPGLIVGLVLGLLSFPVGLRAATRVREIEHGGDR